MISLEVRQIIVSFKIFKFDVCIEIVSVPIGNSLRFSMYRLCSNQA